MAPQSVAQRDCIDVTDGSSSDFHYDPDGKTAFNAQSLI